MEGTVGLCTACAHARTVVSGKGSMFWRCGLSDTDPRFAKYPSLPVLRCAGFVRAGGEGAPPPPERTGAG